MPNFNFTVAGKAAPKPDELRETADRGFEAIELYLERSHLDSLSASIEHAQSCPPEIVSVHTPHVPIDEPEYLLKADELATTLEAYLVIHSDRIINVYTPELEELGFTAEHGYENNPGASRRHLENVILEPGYELVVDTAHLYMADVDYISTIRDLLRTYNEQIHVVHLCDSTLIDDGLGFGEGDMNMAAISQVLQREFSGIVVLEVAQDTQREALERLETYL